MAIISLIAAIVGMVLGTAGFVMSLLSYLRDRPKIKVSLNLNMIETRTHEQFGMVVVTNAGRRPVFISAVVIVPPGVSTESGTHLVINGSLDGNRLGEGDKPYKCIVDKSAFIGHGLRWREIRAYAEDSTGRRYTSAVPNKAASAPKWARAANEVVKGLMLHTFVALVQDKPHVLTRVASLFLASTSISPLTRS